MRSAGAGGGEMGTVPVWENGKNFGDGGGDGLHNVNVLNSLNCDLQRVKTVNFM